MRQTHDRKCFEPTLVSDLSATERKKAQRAMLCLTEKRDRSIKGRTVCNGAPAREWLGQKESASPAAAQESTMSLAVVDARVCRDTVTSDVPNAFVQTTLDCNDGEDCITMKIAEVLVDTLLADNPDLCGGHVVCKNGKKVLHVIVLQAICGMLISALLWHRKFRIDLEENGFLFNPCDARVANKTVDKKQQAIRFHVDNVMSGHIDVGVHESHGSL